VAQLSKLRKSAQVSNLRAGPSATSIETVRLPATVHPETGNPRETVIRSSSTLNSQRN